MLMLPVSGSGFLSTPSARRATNEAVLMDAVFIISIHALREEGDTGTGKRSSSTLLFLSTPSARRATLGRFGRLRRRAYFYPRPPRGGRPRLHRRSCRLSLFLSTPSARRAT